MFPAAVKYQLRIKVNGTLKVYLCKTNDAHHAKVFPVAVLANDVPQAVESGTGVLVDGDLLIRAGRFVLACYK